MKKITQTGAVLAGGLALMLGTGTALAGPGGTYVQGAYADWDDLEDGQNVAASLRIPGGIRFFADYTDTDLEYTRAGLGWSFDPFGPVGFEIGATYQDFSSDAGTEVDGAGVHGNIRVTPLPGLRFGARAERAFLDDEDMVATGEYATIIGFDADWRVLPPFVSLFVSYDSFSFEEEQADNDLVKVGLRGHFSIFPGL